MKKRRNLIISFLLVLALVLTGCGNSTGGEQKPGNGTYEGTGTGFGGEIKSNVVLKDGKIESIKVDGPEETAAIGGAAIPKLVDAIIASQTTKIDAITGATATSKGLIEAVNVALVAGGLDPEKMGPAADAKPQEEKKEAGDLNKTCDVVVVGAGGAGMTAAINSKLAGKEVLLLEKGGIEGGNTSRATGGMNAAETHYQKEKKIDDTVQQFIDDTMKGGHDKNNPELVKVLAEKSAESIDWLDSMGANLSDITLGGGATNPRMHRPLDADGKVIPVGSFLVKTLKAKVDELKIPMIANARVNKVLIEDGKAAGVVAETKDGTLTVKAPAVIICSGGFGSSNDKIKKYRPDLDGYVSTNAATIEGDAIDFLGAIGADFVDMDQIQTHPTVVQKDGALISESLRGDGAILLNQKGQRFVNEMETRDTVSAAINQQPQKTAWILVDKPLYDGSKVIQKYVKNGALTEIKDAKALAEFIGADQKAVEESLSAWQGVVKAKEDQEFNRKNLDTVKSDLSVYPLYAGPVGPGIHHTMGGVKINPQAEVISTEGAPIPGLFAAGEVTGGVHGGNRLGGNAVSDIITFGRIAADSAVKYLAK